MGQSHSIADVIDEMIKHGHEKDSMSLDDYFHPVCERGIPVALVFFALIGILPLSGIPGFSAIVGLIIGLLGLGLLLGREGIRLPRKVGSHQIHGKKITSLLQRTLPVVRWLEKVFRPNLQAIAQSPVRNILGTLFMVLAVLLSLPIPLTNFPISLTIGVLALGLTLRNATLTIIGCLLTACIIGLGVSLINGLL